MKKIKEIVDTSENVDTTAPAQPKFSTVKVNGNWYLQNATGDLVNKFGEPCATVGDAFKYHDEYRANQSCKWLNERG